MPDNLVVTLNHRPDCAFGTGFYRIVLKNSRAPRYCETERELRQVLQMIGSEYVEVVERDGHCLDGDRSGDANTPDVIDAEQWLGWPQERAMREAGLKSEADYARVYREVERAVSRRNDRESQLGVHASIVIKRKGRPLIDALADG